MGIDANIISQSFGVGTCLLFLIAAFLDHRCAIGFSFLAVAFGWFVFTTGGADPEVQKYLTVSRGLFFRATSFFGALMIVAAHVYSRIYDS